MAETPMEFDAPREGFARGVPVTRVLRQGREEATEAVAGEEPLDIRLVHGPADRREERAVSVTMRTPGQDPELAVGFLHTEGVLGDEVEPEDVRVVQARAEAAACTPAADGTEGPAMAAGRVQVVLRPGVVVRLGSLERNFYTTSSCGVCGKASLAALQSVSPPRRRNDFRLQAELLFDLPRRMRAQQRTFHSTGGLHAAALFDATGNLRLLREDVGRHNAVDKLVGASFLAGELPLRDRVLLLSGRASFELLQKAVMAGVPAVAAIGAPSSLAVEIAKAFDVTLVGFLREDHFNLYNGAERVR